MIAERGGKNLYNMCGNNSVDRWDLRGYIWPFNEGDLLGRRGFIDSLLTAATGAHKVNRGIREVLREQDPSLPPIEQEPFMADHFAPWAGGIATKEVDNTKWFEQRYPGQCQAAKDKYKKQIKDYIEFYCAPNINYSTEGMATVVTPLYSGKGTSGTINPRSEVWWANETDFGDKPQTKHSADKILGSFVFKVENINVVMTQSSSDPKRFEYKYTADLLIRDGLGLNKGDTPYYVLGWLFPERGLTRARWTLSGEGSCCEKWDSDTSGFK
jgi:hypothetical protein